MNGQTALFAEPESDRVMDVLTTQPGMQFYTANHIDGEIKGKAGAEAHAQR